MKQQIFEFRVFPEAGGQKDFYFQLRGDTAARSKAGSLAKRENCPVDVAFGGDEPWEDRYITTASPSEYHAAGVRFERLT